MTATQLPEKLTALIRKDILSEEINVSKRKLIKTRPITTTDLFTVCIGDSSYTVSADVDNTGINTMFTRGKCAYLAYRLHALTGYPFAVWTGTATKQWTGHVAIALPSGEYLDIEGVLSNAQVLARYNKSTFTPEPTLYTDATELSTILRGDLKQHHKELGALERELIDYLAHQLMENI